MEGISLHVDTAVHLTPTSVHGVKTDYFRPSCMKRSVTDLNSLPKKRSDRADLETRQSARGNHVPVVSVLYDVPKTPPSPLMYRFRRLHTPLSGQAVGRARSEERINQVAVNVESQRLKGLGVGKCYSEYIPPPTAPEQVRAGFIPGPANNRASHRQSAMPSPMSQSQSASPSRQLPATPQRQLPGSPHRQLPATPSRQSSTHDRAILKSAQTNAINQITNIYNSRQKKNANNETENKTNAQNSKNQHHTYLHSPMLFSQSHHPGAHNVKGEGQIHYHLTHAEGHEGQGYLNGFEGREDHEQSYAAYQNVKSDNSAFLKEYNKNGRKRVVWITKSHEHRSKRQSKLLAESTSSVDESIDRKARKTTDDASSFTLRDLLIRKSKSEAEKCMLTLPKLNVIQFTQERDGSGNGPPGTNTSNTALLNMNQRLNQMKAQKELTSVQMYSQRMVRLRMSQYQRRQLLPWFGSTVVVPQGLGSSSTPTVPYSTADILYGNDVNGKGQSGEDARQNSFGDLERSRELSRQKSKELEQSINNRRPSSKSGKKILSIDSVTPFDRDREDPLKSLSAALPPAKPSHHLRPNGIKSNLIKSEQNYSSKANGAATGREQDDLVAMGTLWSPNNNNGNSGQPVQLASSSSALSSQQQQQQGTGRNASVSSSNTNSYPPKLVPTGGSVNQSLSSSNNMLNTQRKYPGNSMRPIVVQNNVSGRKNSNNSIKEQEEPKYSDPMIGAPASFQQRIIELGALEGDTVRWERSKRLKKKKQDRDS